MEKLQIALCEDQEEEKEQLIRLIQAGEIQAQVFPFESGENFLQNYRPGRYDLVFMDIYMDGISGVEVVRQIREVDAELPVVFVTTSQEHALDGYRLEVAKYMEKPVAQKDVDEALLLAKEKREQLSMAAVTLRGKEFRLSVSDLICVEQKGHYLLFHLEGGRMVQMKGKMDELVPQLAAFPFLRCHKSYLANLTYIIGIDQELLLFYMKEGHAVYIRRDYLKKAKDTWESWLFSQTRKRI